MHVVGQLGLQLAGRAERLVVDELRFQDLVRRLVDRVVAGASLLGEQPLDAEGFERLVDLGIVEFAAAIDMENLDVGKGDSTVANAALTGAASLRGPAECPTISRFARSTSSQTYLQPPPTRT